jgi:hypothetical protein
MLDTLSLHNLRNYWTLSWFYEYMVLIMEFIFGFFVNEENIFLINELTRII